MRLSNKINIFFFIVSVTAIISTEACFRHQFGLDSGSEYLQPQQSSPQKNQPREQGCFYINANPAIGAAVAAQKVLAKHQKIEESEAKEAEQNS